jgi:hypothetical protein
MSLSCSSKESGERLESRGYPLWGGQGLRALVAIDHVASPSSTSMRSPAAVAARVAELAAVAMRWSPISAPGLVVADMVVADLVALDHGLNPLTRPLVGRVQPDLLGAGSRFSFYVEAKQYDKAARSYLLKGLNQVWDMLDELRGTPPMSQRLFL